MNLIKSTLIAAAVAVTMTGSAIAQAEAPASSKIENIVSVNLQDLLNKYYKTQDALKKLAADEESVKKANDERMVVTKGLEKELGELKKKANDPATSEADKKKLAEDFQLKQASLIAKEQERREFIERRMKTLNANKQQQMSLLYEEIVKVIKEKAKAEKYDLVIDASASSAVLGNRVFMFVKESADVTPEILKVLNKEAPADFDASKIPSAGQKPAAEQPAAPAAN